MAIAGGLGTQAAGASAQIYLSARKMSGVLQSTSDGAKFEECRQLAFIAARNIC
jgi:hypothetical protein